MTRDEKIKRIQQLETIKKEYKEALELIHGKNGGKFEGLRDIGLVPKLMYLLRLKKHDAVKYDYSRNKADDELQGIIEIYMTRKIAECDAEIDGFFCDNDGVKFGGKSIGEIEETLNKNANG